ncbi:MAG: inorganic phosphate transporter [Candidatus Methanoperedens sp.]|nr:inorganic phosphate transporter [Candidatus Methanoperedens sp.]MCE8426403.1 inorganic phosphate transporter [Candidatus Methanoperedens sp.]MCE8429398.1 inorganic phosphate transporter [Candidatus Methanoperedens sp.]
MLALLFDFINGFHDSANAIATVVATKVLSPLKAVTMAAVFNLLGPFILGTAIATTIGKGIVNTQIITVNLIFAALLGATLWDLITWYLGLPTSSSHALVGGLIGSAIPAAGIGSLHASGIETIIIFMIISPIVGLVIGFLFALLIMRIFRKSHPSKINNYFRRLQLFSAAFYSLTHGTNDAQKTMGIIAILLVSTTASASSSIDKLPIPLWVIVSCAAAIGLGTFFGGWKIVKTMAQRVTRLRPYQGFAAETSSGIVLAVMATMGIPVSTTHVISSSIMGVGATDKLSAVRWGIARKIVGAWILTIPAAALISASTYLIINSIF